MATTTTAFGITVIKTRSELRSLINAAGQDAVKSAVRDGRLVISIPEGDVDLVTTQELHDQQVEIDSQYGE